MKVLRTLGLATMISGFGFAYDPSQHKGMQPMGKGGKGSIEFLVLHHRDGFEMLRRCEQVAQHPGTKGPVREVPC